MAYVRMTRTMAVPVGAPAAGGQPLPLGAADAGAGGAVGPGAPAAVATNVTSFAGSAVGGKTAQPIFWAIAYGSIAAGFVIGVAVNLALKPSEFRAGAGFEAFAAFYIVAQGLERLFEPVANFVRGSVAGAAATGSAVGGTPTTGGTPPGSLTRPEAVAKLDQALAAAATAADAGTAAEAMADAARAKATIDQIRANAALSMWGIQSGLAMILCGGLGLFLLRGVGAAGVPVFLDILITGIAIGGGSKALHDLIKSVQVTKEGKQDPPEAGGSA
jgi:hypothetical protein